MMTIETDRRAVYCPLGKVRTGFREDAAFCVKLTPTSSSSLLLLGERLGVCAGTRRSFSESRKTHRGGTAFGQQIIAKIHGFDLRVNS